MFFDVFLMFVCLLCFWMCLNEFRDVVQGSFGCVHFCWMLFNGFGGRRLFYFNSFCWMWGESKKLKVKHLVFGKVLRLLNKSVKSQSLFRTVCVHENSNQH